MKLTFSKTLLCSIVFVGLTACGSGGGSSKPTTTPKVNDISVPTTKVGFDGKAGTAIYKGKFDATKSKIFNGASRTVQYGGDFTLNADFDQKHISGNGKIFKDEGSRSANITFEKTNLSLDSSKNIVFEGSAKGKIKDFGLNYNGALQYFDATGTYKGSFEGNNAEKVNLSFEVKGSNKVASGVGTGAKVEQ